MGLYKFLDNKRTLWIFLGLLVVLIVISILTSNVYRKVGLQGTVYVWNNAPAGATSQAYTFDTASKEALAWTPPAGMDVTPLGGAYITYRAIYHAQEDDVLAISSKDGTYAKKSARWKVTGDIHLDITASKDGYQSVNGTATNKEGFFYSGSVSVAYFILVPDK
jgi:hypothetical protein